MTVPTVDEVNQALHGIGVSPLPIIAALKPYTASLSHASPQAMARLAALVAAYDPNGFYTDPAKAKIEVCRQIVQQLLWFRVDHFTTPPESEALRTTEWEAFSVGPTAGTDPKP